MVKRLGRFAASVALVSASDCGGGAYSAPPIHDVLTSVSIGGKVARGAVRHTFTDARHLRKVEHLLNVSTGGMTYTKLKPGSPYILEVRLHEKDGWDGFVYIDNDTIYLGDTDSPERERETNSDPNGVFHNPLSRTQRLAWCAALETRGCDY